MTTIFEQAVVVTPTFYFEPGVVAVADDGKIAFVGPASEAKSLTGKRIRLGGRRVIPGLIDIHTHGGHGITFDETAPAGPLAEYSRWAAGSGVTGFLCSIAAPDFDTLERMVAAYVKAFEAGLPGAEALGLHLEGPFLNPEKKGAFNPAWLRKPDLDVLRRVLKLGRGWIRQMTLAPELEGAPEAAALLRAAGVTAALGHTNTTYETASAALRGDFNHVTHTFNAQRGFDHRQPGVFGAVLTSDKVTAELIADTIHVHPGAMKVLIRCLGAQRVVLVTDAMAGAGLVDGQYDLVGHTVTVKDGRATLADGTIAGSTAMLNQCVRNVYQLTGVSLGKAVKMASLNPARVIGVDRRLGRLAPGKDASLAVVDDNFNVAMTLVNGKIVHNTL